MTEELDAIVFDVGGTLLDMKPSRADVFAEVIARHGHITDPPSIRTAVARVDRIMDERRVVLDRTNESAVREEFVGLVMDLVGLKDDSESMRSEIIHELGERVPEVNNWMDYPETKEVLQRLRARGFVLGVVSNATDLVRRVLDNLDLTRGFDFVIVSDEVGVNKPCAKIFRIAAEKAHTSPNRMLYVGDKLFTDVKGAVGAGMNAILVDRTDTYRDVDCIRIRDLSYLTRFL